MTPASPEPRVSGNAFAEIVPEGALSAKAMRNALAGFFLSGLLMSFLGPILPAWGYHLQSDYNVIGYYFLSLNAGLVLSVPLAQKLLAGRTLRFVGTLGCALAAAALFYLAAVGPPLGFEWRLAGVALCGMGAGLLSATVFTAVTPAFRRDPAATVNLSGLLFGLGSLTSSLLVAGTFYVYSTGAILFLLAVIPAYLSVYYLQTPIPAEALPPQAPLRRALEDFRSPAAVLFATLLFFQFGNEWAIAGWLPVFLIQRLGVSPANSLLLLSLYWLALIVGRLAMQAVLPRVRHGRLLMASVVAAMFGCIILSLTDNVFGAATALLMVGGGFASIYPLVVEKIGARFPGYHPGVFNGLFSFAATGGLLAAASLGMLAEWLGIAVIMGLPLIGSIAVFLLLVVIWLEARFHSE